MVKKLLIAVLLAGFASTAHAMWKYNPFTSKLDLVSDLHPYVTYDSTNYELDFSTSVNITGDLFLSGNLGVGTESPASAVGYTGSILHIVGAEPVLRLQETGTSPKSDIEMAVSGGKLSYVNNEVSPTAQLTFDFTNSKFGINDVTPDAQLEIKSNRSPTEYAVLVSSQDDTTVLFSVNGAGGITNIEGALTDSTIVTADIKDGEILEADLNFSNSPTDNYLASYNAAGGNFTWVVSPAGGGGASTLQVTVDGVEITSPTVTLNMVGCFDGYANGSISDIRISTGAVTNGTVTTIPNSDQVYDFVNDNYEPTVTEGSLADSTIVSADIKDDTIDSADYAAGSIDFEHLAVDVVHGAGADTLAAADEFLFYDDTGGALDNITLAGLEKQIFNDNNGNYLVVISSPAELGVGFIPISPFRAFAVTITTITAQIVGGTNCIGMFEEVTAAGIQSAGTDVLAGDLTIDATWRGGTISNGTIAAGSCIVYKPTSVSGDVGRLMIRYTLTKD